MNVSKRLPHVFNVDESHNPFDLGVVLLAGTCFDFVLSECFGLIAFQCAEEVYFAMFIRSFSDCPEKLDGLFPPWLECC